MSVLRRSPLQAEESYPERSRDQRDQMHPQVLTAQEVFKRLSSSEDGVVLVDIRNPEEWLYDGRIEGATWIPMYELPVRACDELPDDKDVVLYCAHGVRSAVMARYLRRSGFDNVCDMEGGLEAWAQVGLPVDRP